MSTKNWIEFPRVEGKTSRQAHADLPEGTFEREIGRDGFFGPATHIYHRHPPTGWSDFEGPLRPRSFDAVKAAKEATAEPYRGALLLSNASCRIALWRCEQAMPRLQRNADGDVLLFIHAGIEARDFVFPSVARKIEWRRFIDTAAPSPNDIYSEQTGPAPPADGAITLAPRSLVCYVSV